MKSKIRNDYIIELLEQRGFLSVNELSRLCEVSEMTIRRDLEVLDSQNRIRRTYGGAIAVRGESEIAKMERGDISEKNPEVLDVDQVDVLIATSVNPYYDGLLEDRAQKKGIPIIAESISIESQKTIVAADNYQAGKDLGIWAGKYLQERGVAKATLLDLTFHQPNTQERSRGFVDGVREACPSTEVVLSINAQSRFATALQLAKDALSVYPQINLIFAINDITALGAIEACHELRIDPQQMTVMTFGLEGDTLRNELMQGGYCKAGLAMFPEIVGRTCIEAAISAFNKEPLPERFTTPHIVLTSESLTHFYQKKNAHWEINWQSVAGALKFPCEIDRRDPRSEERLPARIGLIVPFTEHEWYKNLTETLKSYAGQFGIALQVIDANQNARDEVEFRRIQIARKAAALINPGNVVLVDGGPMAAYLAEEIKQKKDITVITNSITVFDLLNNTPGITLVSTGGVARYSSQMLVGPTAEGALKELRAEMLFLMVSGISLGYGLSHHTISEVTMKQAMIRSAKEVILLADHTAFDAETGIQVASLSVVHKLITDDALPPSTRLEISKSGIQMILA